MEELYESNENEVLSGGAPPLKRTWTLPVVTAMDDLIRDRYMDRMVQELSGMLADGRLSELLGVPVVSERIGRHDCRAERFTYWRLNQTDFLADVFLSAGLDTAVGDEDVRASFSLWMCLWFGSDENGFDMQIRDVGLPDACPERELWKLDRFLVPILRHDEIEDGADRLWKEKLPLAKDLKQRDGAALAAAMGLNVVRLRLCGKKGVRCILFFDDGCVPVAEEQPRGCPAPLPPRIVRVQAGTIVVNSAVLPGHDVSEHIFHECAHYEWHLLFFRLQRMASSDVSSMKTRTVSCTTGHEPANPVMWMERQASAAAAALVLPARETVKMVRRLYQEASASPSLNGYYNHDGWRYDRVIRRVSASLGIGKGFVRRRLVSLGFAAAKGAVNYVDGKYITPFAFSQDYAPGQGDSFVIDRRGLAELYRGSSRFRELMAAGDHAYVDGHVCLLDPEFVQDAPEGPRLTAWANAHADACCVRFREIYIRDHERIYSFGTLNSDEEYTRHYHEYLDRKGRMSPAERKEKRDRLMKDMPDSFPEALTYLMGDHGWGKITEEKLAERAMLSRSTVHRYRTGKGRQYRLDTVVALCIALRLPPWLSDELLKRAGLCVSRYGDLDYYGEILDCCFMDSLRDVQAYLIRSGYPPLKLLDE